MNILLQRCYSRFSQFERSKNGEKPIHARDLEQSANPVAEARDGEAVAVSLGGCEGAHD
jgi:hypothetical protein